MYPTCIRFLYGYYWVYRLPPKKKKIYIKYWLVPKIASELLNSQSLNESIEAVTHAPRPRS